MTSSQLKQLDAFISEQEAEQQARAIAESGIPLGEIQTDPTLRKIQSEQVKTGTYKSPVEEKPMSGESAKLTGVIRSGLESVGGIRETMGEDFEGADLALFGARTPLTPWGRGLEKDIYNLADAILRLRTGAAAPEAEVKRFMKVIGPSPLDPDEVKKQKIEDAEIELRQVAESLGFDPKVETKKKDEINTTTGFQNIEGSALGSVVASDATTPETTQSQDGIIRNIAEKTADIAPVAGGILGGVGGSIAGLPAAIPTLGGSSLAGGAAGAAIGTGAGVAMQNMIEDLLGTQEEAGTEQVSSALKQAGVAGATDLALGGAFKLVGKSGNMILKSLKEGVDNIPVRGLRLAPSDISKFVKKHGEDVAQFLVRNKIMGEEALERALQQAGKLQEGFDNLALRTDIEIPIRQVDEQVSKQLLDIAQQGKTAVTRNAKKLAKEMLEEYNFIRSQFGDTITPEQLTLIRRQLDDFTPKTAFNNLDQAMVNANIRLRRAFNNVVADVVDARMIGEGTGFRQIGKELSKYYDFLEFAEKRAAKGRGTLLANLTRLGSVGVGGVLGGPVGAMGGLLAEPLLRDPEVLRVLYMLGQTGKKVEPFIRQTGKAIETAIPPAIGAAASQLVK